MIYLLIWKVKMYDPLEIARFSLQILMRKGSAIYHPSLTVLPLLSSPPAPHPPHGTGIDQLLAQHQFVSQIFINKKKIMLKQLNKLHRNDYKYFIHKIQYTNNYFNFVL